MPSVSKASPFLTGSKAPEPLERYSRERHGGSKHPRDLQAHKSFEQGRDGGWRVMGGSRGGGSGRGRPQQAL